VLVACVSFCLISAGIYALNDARDVAEDRLHPRKRYRPVAAGELSRRDAVVIGVLWLLAGLAGSLFISTLLGAIALGYVALTLSYTVVWRHVLLIDVLVVAAGFVLRALAGGAAAPVALSRWFVLVVSAAALFIAAGKRHAELLRLTQTGPAAGFAAGRRVMRGYSERGLRLLLAGSGAVALFAYWVWAFDVPDVDGVPWRPLTALPFTFCLLRYAARIRSGHGEAPEEMILGDPALILGGLAWLILFALNVHAGV
jgi:decaprenyl-phosphate phosphoribosyltransferase